MTKRKLFDPPGARAQRLAATAIFAWHGHHAQMLDATGDEIAAAGLEGPVILALAERIDPSQVSADDIAALLELEGFLDDPAACAELLADTERQDAIDAELTAMLRRTL